MRGAVGDMERGAADRDEHKLRDEEGRLAAVARYGIVDTPREESFDKITALVRDILGVPICAVSLIERDRQWFKSIQGMDGNETPRETAFCHHTIQKREPMIVPDATRDDRFAENPLVTGNPGIRSYAGVPLRSPDGYNLGALCAVDTSPRDFTPAQLAILDRFAELVVNEMELRTIAQRDFLTGAASRRAFTEAAKRAIERFDREGRLSALVMFDADHFKKINDEYGHGHGDDVLKALTDCCEGALRASDILGRLGGEEFGILLTERDASGAMAIAERLRAEISKMTFSWAPDLHVTASFGVSSLRSGLSVEDWLADADGALYRAKREGRNRTVYSGDLPSPPA